MKLVEGFKNTVLFFLVFNCITTQTFASDPIKSTPIIAPVTTSQIFDKAKNNNNWKLAFLTGKSAQIVFMNISPKTNPSNEIGMETHKFDQVIFIVEGKAKAILNGKQTLVEKGDSLFIPEGTSHNVINLNANAPLKIISIYSKTDIPANSVYKKNSDTQGEQSESKLP